MSLLDSQAGYRIFRFCVCHFDNPLEVTRRQVVTKAFQRVQSMISGNLLMMRVEQGIENSVGRILHDPTTTRRRLGR